MDFEVSTVVETYKKLALVPSPTSAFLLPSFNQDVINIYSVWSVPDLIRSESTKFAREFSLEYQSDQFRHLFCGVPNDITSVSQCAFTKSGEKYAVLRKAKKSEELVYLELWSSSSKECTFDVTDHKEHGKIHDSGEFDSFEWSTNERYLLYIADMKHKKSESYFKDVFCQKTENKINEEVTKGEEYIYQESWGESYSSIHHTVLCIFDTETGQVEVLNMDDKYPNISIAQATWGPNDEFIVFVGYKESPYRLGLVYCSNRRSAIYSFNLKSKDVVCLTNDEDVCIEYPVFSPDFETLVFLQNKPGPHKSCRKLMKYDWVNKKQSTVIDIVENANADEFAGIYITRLSHRWFSRNGRYFFFHTFRRSFLNIFCVDLQTSKVQKIDIEQSYGSCCLLDVKDPYILAAVSSPKIPPRLMVGYITSNLNGSDEIKVNWMLVGPCLEFKDLNWKVSSFTPSLPNKTYTNLDCEIITVSSNDKKNGTLVIFPHGGPHSSFFANYSVYVAGFARLGFIVCQVNYRGSTGFGENSIKSLPGNIGSQDVSDVVDAIKFMEKDEDFSFERVVGFGGSHGGFLIAHLLGQYPDLLKAAVIRNPVIDLSSMAGTSDIPDWCWIEVGLTEKYDPSKSVDPPKLKQMWEKSPIRYITNVKSPTLLCLGKSDLRVPSSQGFQFYRSMKAQNVPVKVFYYDDNHALSKVGVSSDAFVQIMSWFQTHLNV